MTTCRCTVYIHPCHVFRALDSRSTARFPHWGRLRVVSHKKVLRSLLITLLTASANSFAASFTDDSYKNVKIGTSAAVALKTLVSYKDTKEVYEPSSACYYLVPKAGEDTDAIFMITDGKVSRIDNYDSKNVSTREGITIGSTKSDILDTYKDVKISPHPYVAPEGEYLEVRLENGLGIIFETYDDLVTSFRLGDESIRYIEGCL